MTHGAVPVHGSHGGVVAPHYLATAVGLEVLRQGGHAVDAAIATNAVLGVVMPDACGIGGDAFWLIWDANARKQFALNGSGPAGSTADASALRARGLTEIPSVSPESITVPGAVHSWAVAHARFGRLSAADVLAPAINFARDGFAAWPGFVAAVEEMTPAIMAAYGPGADFFRVFRPEGRPWVVGEQVRFDALATTLERLVRSGFRAFYRGDMAERHGAFLDKSGSQIRRDDIENYSSYWSDPVATTYRGVRVTTHPPNSPGAVALEILNILEAFQPPPASLFKSSGLTDAAWIHLGIEAARLAVADRDANLGDPAFADQHLDRLLSKEYASKLGRRISRTEASTYPPSGIPSGGGTVYLATVDGNGNAVSLIQSNYFRFGSGLVDPETGVVYQDRGCYFRLESGHPNELKPGKRPLHTLMPGMLFKDEAAPWVVLGSMGGDAQTQIHAQIVSALVDGGLDVASAVAAPRWFARASAAHITPDEVLVEPRFSGDVIARLNEMGHRLVLAEDLDERVGHAHAIEMLDGGPGKPGGAIAAATDPRSVGLPAVW